MLRVSEEATTKKDRYGQPPLHSAECTCTKAAGPDTVHAKFEQVFPEEDVAASFSTRKSDGNQCCFFVQYFCSLWGARPQNEQDAFSSILADILVENEPALSEVDASGADKPIHDPFVREAVRESSLEPGASFDDNAEVKESVQQILAAAVQEKVEQMRSGNLGAALFANRTQPAGASSRPAGLAPAEAAPFWAR